MIQLFNVPQTRCKPRTAYFLVNMSFHLLGILGVSSTKANAALTNTSKEPGIPSIETSAPSAFQTIRQNIRMRTFTEFMVPGLQSDESYVPQPDGSNLVPTNSFNYIWIDYSIAKNTKLLYWQRFHVNFASTPSTQTFYTNIRNPRFALRQVNLFEDPNISSIYDFYIQPGLANEATTAGRNFEFGVRTATTYSLPTSAWKIGFTSETTVSISKDFSTGPNFYGWVMPWASYDLTKVFSTQHYITVNFQHMRGTSGLQWDLPMPYTQNGIGATLSETVWVGALLNNYLTTLPTLANTWASLWLSLSLL